MYSTMWIMNGKRCKSKPSKAKRYHEPSRSLLNLHEIILPFSVCRNLIDGIVVLGDAGSAKYQNGKIISFRKRCGHLKECFHRRVSYLIAMKGAI